MQALARRDLTAAELDQRLARAGLEEPERAAAVAKLVDAGYVDDGRFAEARAAVLAERGLGDEAIRCDLECRGIEPELVQRALQGLEPERDRARRVAERAGGGVRAAQVLARKGFEADTIEAIARQPGAELGYRYTI